MALSEEDLIQLLQAGRESLNTEFKPWFPLSEDSGKATLAKACIAIRNADGGFLVIGMSNDGAPDNRKHVSDVRTVFHHDAVQEVVSRYASDLFEITVHFVPFDGMERVIVEVPSGVRTPVICRNNLPRNVTSEGYQPGTLLKEGEVYVRTHASNGRPSTSPAKIIDWQRIMETCFNNREADIGAFMRRQLSGLDVEAATSAIFEMLKGAKGPTLQERTDAYLDVCLQKYVGRVKELGKPLPNIGTREVAAAISGDFEPPSLDEECMWQFAHLQRMSGWAPFVAFLNMSARIDDIRYDESGADVLTYDDRMFHILDFSRIERSGQFYFFEPLPGDFSPRTKAHTVLEFVQETARIAEIIAVIMQFAKAFCGNDSKNQVTFAFRWEGLANRRLGSMDRMSWSRGVATQNDYVTHATIPVSIAISAIGLHVESIVKQLFRLFAGHAFDSTVIQNIVEDRMNSRL